jgi:hypothetical protein
MLIKKVLSKKRNIEGRAALGEALQVPELG